MIGWTSSVDAARRNFFDWKKIQKGMATAEDRVHSKFGAFVRTRARSQMKRKKGSSKPGQPPHAHGEGLIKKYLYFSKEPQKHNVVIGPARLNHVYYGGDGQPLRGETIPSVLESGGQIRILEWFRHGSWYRADMRSRRRIAEENIPVRMKTVNIEARPNMKPAFDRELPGLSKLWTNALHRAA